MLSGALLASEIVTKLSWDLASQYVTEFPSGSYPLVKLYPAGVVKTSGLSAPGNQFTACRIPGRGLCSVCKLFPPKHGNLTIQKFLFSLLILHDSIIICIKTWKPHNSETSIKSSYFT